MSLPENQRKLEAVEQLAGIAHDAGLSLIELASGVPAAEESAGRRDCRAGEDLRPRHTRTMPPSTMTTWPVM